MSVLQISLPPSHLLCPLLLDEGTGLVTVAIVHSNYHVPDHLFQGSDCVFVWGTATHAEAKLLGYLSGSVFEEGVNVHGAVSRSSFVRLLVLIEALTRRGQILIHYAVANILNCQIKHYRRPDSIWIIHFSISSASNELHHGQQRILTILSISLKVRWDVCLILDV
jgi:hypothetical protein